MPDNTGQVQNTYSLLFGTPVNLIKITGELQTVLPTVQGVSQKGNSYTVLTTVELPTGSKQLVNDIFADHDPFDLKYSQDYAKELCEDHYEYLTTLGMSYGPDSVLLGTSEVAQGRWTALALTSANLTYPFIVPSIENDSVLVLDDAAALNTVYGNLFAHCMGLFGALSAAKGGIMAATDQDGIDTVVNGYIV